MAVLLVLGFASGLPLALTSSTLFIWLADTGVNKTTIGLLASIGTPYAFKFLWSPLMDALALPGLTRALGRRRSWLIFCQLVLFGLLLLMGMQDPASAPGMLALVALAVAIASASQDIVADAFRVEWLEVSEQAAGAATFVFGYRVGMIVSTAGALYLADLYGWPAAYCFMALALVVPMAVVLAVREPEATAPAPQTKRTPSQWVREAVIAPFADFMTRAHWLAILFFILLYKFGDAFMGVMAGPFYIELGFSKPQIAGIVKLFGLTATIAGGFAGGALVWRMGLLKSLWVCGIAQALTNLVFAWLAGRGADVSGLAVAITLENFSGGMSTTAFVAYLSSLCNRRFTATQYALLSSLASAGRTWLSTPAGLAAQVMGWPVFFVLSTFLAIPGLIALWWLGKKKVF